ncbi:MAG: hypothetical protein LBU62_03950 [Bacteroidales bacterium]|jgi:hypothetical protein|nr:hypothetical protein [Bacteroidales bacterium]
MKWKGIFGWLTALMLFCCGTIYGRQIELEVIVPDSLSFRHLYVLNAGNNDTLAVFDSMYVGYAKRSTLYFPSKEAQYIRLLLLTTSWQRIESASFSISARHSAFTVTINDLQIKVTRRDFRYPQKNEDDNSYWVFLLIFFLVKILISTACIYAMNLPRSLLYSISGVFLLSSLIYWSLPMFYLLRILVMVVFEFGILFLMESKKMPLLHNALLVIAENIAGVGLIELVYLFYVFW